MELTTVLYGVILGMFLAIGDHVAMRQRISTGFGGGLAVWLAMVLLPLLLVGAFVSIAVVLVGMVVGTVLSFLLVRQRRRHRYGAPAYE